MDEFDEFGSYELPPVVEPVKKKQNWVVISIAAVCAFALATVAGVLGYRALSGSVTAKPSPAADYSASPTLYHEPEDMGGVIEKALAATVTVYCGESSGTAWGIKLPDDPKETADNKYKYKLVTNHHVIEECLDGQPISFTFGTEELERPAHLLSYDDGFSKYESFGDLAILMTDYPVPTLDVAKGSPKVGHWVMAVGTPGSTLIYTDLFGNVTFGHVTFYDKEISVIVTDAALNHGNSGGPLINSNGDVIGTNSWIESKDEVDNISYSIGLPVLCEKVLVCSSSDPKRWGN